MVCYTLPMTKTELYPSGAVRLSGAADAQGRWCGEVCEYLETGALRKRSPYREGVRHGVEKVYRPDGTVEQEITYRGGVASGVAVFYYPDGKRRREVFFGEGRILSSADYAPDGTLDTSGDYLKSSDI